MAEMSETIESFEIFDANGKEAEPRQWITNGLGRTLTTKLRNQFHGRF
jgi:hypothetical protein